MDEGAGGRRRRPDRRATAPSATPSRRVAFLRTLPAPYVVKTDGLAAGKGVLVTDSLVEAEADVQAKLAGAASATPAARS